MKLIFITILIQITYQQDQFKISFVHDSIRNRDTKCSEIIDFFLARAYKYNRDLKAIINYNPIARLQAQLLDEYYDKNSKLIGKLHCIPTIVKDNIDVKEIPTTGGLKALRYSIPNEDALIIKRLRQQGAIFIAKSNMVELGFAVHSSSETGNGSCQNPFDSSMSCGTSSSGSGVSVSAGLAILALGTDTSGSITYPAAQNGVYGLRTQFNNPNMNGIIPIFEQQDTVGPMSKYINDLVLSYSIMIDNETIYNEFNRTDNEFNLKISILNLFFNSFQYDETSFYKVDDNYKLLLNDIVELMKSIQLLNVTRIKMTREEIIDKETLFKNMTNQFGLSFNGCISKSLDKYFTNKKRFQHDAPVKSFKDLLNNPFLSKYWSKILQDSIKKKCNLTDYNKIKLVYSKFINGLFKIYDADVIAIPHRNENIELTNNIPQFDNMAVYSNNLAFNIPIGYSEPTSDAPSGFPAGLILISRSDRIIQSFKIARLIEKAKNTAKLPLKTPLIN